MKSGRKVANVEPATDASDTGLRRSAAAAAGGSKFSDLATATAPPSSVLPPRVWGKGEAPAPAAVPPVAEKSPPPEVSGAAAPESLPLGKQIVYAVGQLGWSALVGIVSIQLVYFYLPPSEDGATIFPVYITQASILVVFNVITLLATAGRLWDAFTDPLIAGWSDRLQHRRGRRIPFMAAGALPATLFCALLFVPVVQEESAWNVVWLAFTETVFFFALTLYCTPYFSLVADLGHTAEERLNLCTWISVTFTLGTVLASGAPMIGGLVAQGDALSNLRTGISIVCAIACVCMYVPVLLIDERRYCHSEPSQVSVLAALGRCVRNPYFRCYAVADFNYWFASGIITTGLPYYMTVLLQIDDDFQIVFVATVAVLTFALYYPINRTARHLGKKRLVLFALFLILILFAFIFFLGWLPFPAMAQSFALAACASVPLAILGVLPNAILADIAHHDSLKHGQNQEGMYFAAHALLNKLGLSCGIMVLASLTNFGKDVGDDLGIRLSGPVGVVLGIVSFVCFLAYREDELLADLEELGKTGPAKPPRPLKPANSVAPDPRFSAPIETE